MLEHRASSTHADSSIDQQRLISKKVIKSNMTWEAKLAIQHYLSKCNEALSHMDALVEHRVTNTVDVDPSLQLVMDYNNMEVVATRSNLISRFQYLVDKA